MNVSKCAYYIYKNNTPIPEVDRVKCPKDGIKLTENILSNNNEIIKEKKSTKKFK